jgi:hypothetical protein
VICCNRQKRNVASPFDCFSDVTLMGGTVPGNSAGYDLAALRDEKAECAWFFVINGQVFLCTEAADLATLKRASLAGTALSSGATCRTLSRA